MTNAHPMPPRFPHLLSAGSLLLSCAACSVYTPMTPHAPLIRAEGEGEVSFHLQGTGRAELQAAYSPCKSLLLLTAATGRPDLSLNVQGEKDGFQTLQYELGLGTYFPMGERWSGQLTGGFGGAQVQRIVTRGFGGQDYKARYQKYFGQLSFNQQVRRHGNGFGYRLAVVDFSQLSAQDRYDPYTLYDLPLDGQFRHEFYYFYRRWLGRALTESHWYAQAGGGYSFCLPGASETAADPIVNRAQTNRGAILLLSVGIGYSLRKY